MGDGTPASEVRSARAQRPVWPDEDCWRHGVLSCSRSCIASTRTGAGTRTGTIAVAVGCWYWCRCSHDTRAWAIAWLPLPILSRRRAYRSSCEVRLARMLGAWVSGGISYIPRSPCNCRARPTVRGGMEHCRRREGSFVELVQRRRRRRGTRASSPRPWLIALASRPCMPGARHTCPSRRPALSHCHAECLP